MTWILRLRANHLKNDPLLRTDPFLPGLFSELLIVESGLMLEYIACVRINKYKLWSQFAMC